jgi:16S rRNA (guanine527-N7)-methyltransferase
VELICKYFPNLTDRQIEQFACLDGLYREWNSKINVISRKDMDCLYEHHVLHSLAIAKYINFRPGTKILDVGTGGGFPGIPLAIMFPDVTFKMIDSIEKKIKVTRSVAESIGLQNAEIVQENAKLEKGKFDFVVSRAVMNAADLVKLTRKNVLTVDKNSIPNGLICLKGGDLNEEMKAVRNWYELTDISNYFTEDFFATKKILYIPLK